MKATPPNTMRDRFTGFPIHFDADHHYIHEGQGFNYSGNTGSVAAAGTYTYEESEGS